MNRMQKEAYDLELRLAANQFRARRDVEAMSHLERAHVLGQREVWAHVVTHAWMLRLAVQRRSLRDAIGQCIRLVLGAIGSAVGRVPIGNTGGSDVNMFKPMPVAPELAALLRGERYPDAGAETVGVDIATDAEPAGEQDAKWTMAAQLDDQRRASQR